MKIALTNVPPDYGESIAKTLIKEQLVACVNFYPTQSTYLWKEKVQMHTEMTLMMKVASDGLKALRRRVLELSPYDLPEFVVLEVDIKASSEKYVKWVHEETK